jgi:PKHD-type hydroxylase
MRCFFSKNNKKGKIMLIHIPNVLNDNEVQRCKKMLIEANWVDGNVTSGTQAAKMKNNLQLPEDCYEAIEIQKVILDALSKNGLFFSAALPKKIFPPLFNCYTGEMNSFGNHVDNAVRTLRGGGKRVRSDLSFTLFFSNPDEYEGGELVIEDTFGEQRVKLNAGDMILYPSSSVHRVEPVTSGARICSFTWLESMVREVDKRRLLFDMDMSIISLRETIGDNDDSIRFTSCYHNLLRMWADT